MSEGAYTGLKYFLHIGRSIKVHCARHIIQFVLIIYCKVYYDIKRQYYDDNNNNGSNESNYNIVNNNNNNNNNTHVLKQVCNKVTTTTYIKDILIEKTKIYEACDKYINKV